MRSLTLKTPVVAALTLAVTLAASPGFAASSVGITEKGRGPALVFLPGLNSGSATFSGTCEAFAATHSCLLLTLPGFAGQAPINVDGAFLEPMRDAVIELLRGKQVGGATLVGHSLGGVVAMMVALEAPELAARLVLVDSLPFYPAIQDPTATVEKLASMATMMRTQMASQSDAAYLAGAIRSTAGMTRDAQRQDLLQTWTRDSDRATTTQAMFDMLQTDLRARLKDLKQPALVLGSWAAYAQYGSTLESTRAIFSAQYAAAPDVDIQMSENGYHFLTWDDPAWVNGQITAFISR